MSSPLTWALPDVGFCSPPVRVKRRHFPPPRGPPPPSITPPALVPSVCPSITDPLRPEYHRRIDAGHAADRYQRRHRAHHEGGGQHVQEVLPPIEHRKLR